MTHTNSNPFEPIYSELNELKVLVKQILNTPKEDHSSKLYTIKEASLVLKCDRQTIRNHINVGTLIAHKHGASIRIPHDQIFNSNNEVKSIKYKRRA